MRDLVGPGEQRGDHAAANAVLRLLAGAVGETDDRERRDALRQVRLDLDSPRLEPDEGEGDGPPEHTPDATGTRVTRVSRVCAARAPCQGRDIPPLTRPSLVDLVAEHVQRERARDAAVVAALGRVPDHLTGSVHVRPHLHDEQLAIVRVGVPASPAEERLLAGVAVLGDVVRVVIPSCEGASEAIEMACWRS